MRWVRLLCPPKWFHPLAAFGTAPRKLQALERHTKDGSGSCSSCLLPLPLALRLLLFFLFLFLIVFLFFFLCLLLLLFVFLSFSFLFPFQDCARCFFCSLENAFGRCLLAPYPLPLLCPLPLALRFPFFFLFCFPFLFHFLFPLSSSSSERGLDAFFVAQKMHSGDACWLLILWKGPSSSSSSSASFSSFCSSFEHWS